MLYEDKLSRLKVLLGVFDTSEDDTLTALLDVSRDAILGWMYSAKGEIPNDVSDVPRAYEQVQLMAIVVGYNMLGAEGQSSHNENGISRQFNYPDMLAYIRKNVTAYAGGIAR